MNSTTRTRLTRSHLECLLTLLAVLWLAWLARGFGAEEWLAGAGDRYRKDLELRVELPPEARRGWVAWVCSRFRGELPATDASLCKPPPGPVDKAGVNWRNRLGLPAGVESPPAAKPAGDEARRRVRESLPELGKAYEALGRAFFEPLAASQRQRAEWERHAAEGFVAEGGEDEFRNAVEQTREYREIYRLEIRSGVAAPKPLECAWRYLSRRLERTAAPGPEATPVPALLAMAALLDGNPGKLPGVAFWAKSDWDERESHAGCAGSPTNRVEPLETARQGAGLVRLARISAGHAAKAAAVQDLLPKASRQLAIWALAGWLVLLLGRHPVRPNRMLGFAFLIWAVAAALARPRLEWLGGGDPGWLAGWWKAPLVLVLAAVAAMQWLPKSPVPASLPSTALGYPGFVLFVGLGWWLLLDLSAFGHFDNRFQGLYQQSNVFAAFLAVSLVPALRAPLARTALRCLGFWPLQAAGPNRRALGWWTLGLWAALAVLATVWILGKGHRQLTSEIFRVLLLAGLAWFLLARADILASPWLRVPPLVPGLWPRQVARLRTGAYRLKLAAPLFPLLFVTVGGLLLTDDGGPLLVILYAGSIFAGVGAALFLSEKAGWTAGILAGMAALGAYLWGLSYALLRYGGYLGSRIQQRVESAQQPFLASNDQMAHVLWFQEAAADAGGFGFGAVPWCGELAEACQGVPPQIQSDYIFTALLGLFGPWAWALLALSILWLWRVARAHPKATSGRVDADDPGQAWLSWVTLCWAGLTLTQTAVTVAGNLCWLPLTGITFPFVSYGAWSLLANTLFLGAALNLNRNSP